MIIGKYNGSVILTYLGVALALAGIRAATEGKPHAVMVFLVLAGVCDLFDGTAAARFKRNELEKAFGRGIDSLADMVSFIALPAVFALTLPGGSFLTFPAVVIYALAGIIRLAWFSIEGTKESRGDRYYRGLPVTYAALILPILYLPLSLLPAGAFSVLWPLIHILTAMAFILDIGVRKPDRAMMIKLLLLAAAVIVVYMLPGVFS